MRWERPCQEHGRRGHNYLHYGHGAVLVPARPREPPGSVHPSPASASCGSCWGPSSRGAERSRLPSVPPSVLTSFHPCVPSPAAPSLGSSMEQAASSSCCAGSLLWGGRCSLLPLGSQTLLVLPRAVRRESRCRVPGPALHCQQSLRRPTGLLGAASTSPAASHLPALVGVCLPAAALLSAQLPLFVCCGGGGRG